MLLLTFVGLFYNFPITICHKIETSSILLNVHTSNNPPNNMHKQVIKVGARAAPKNIIRSQTTQLLFSEQQPTIEQAALPIEQLIQNDYKTGKFSRAISRYKTSSLSGELNPSQSTMRMVAHSCIKTKKYIEATKIFEGIFGKRQHSQIGVRTSPVDLKFASNSLHFPSDQTNEILFKQLFDRVWVTAIWDTYTYLSSKSEVHLTYKLLGMLSSSVTDGAQLEELLNIYNALLNSPEDKRTDNIQDKERSLNYLLHLCLVYDNVYKALTIAQHLHADSILIHTRNLANLDRQCESSASKSNLLDQIFGVVVDE